MHNGRLRIFLLIAGFASVVLVSAAFTLQDAEDPPGGASPSETVAEPSREDSATEDHAQSTEDMDPTEADPGLESLPEMDGPLVVLPEIRRSGPRHFLSSFRLPKELEFAGQRVPLDQWHVRERIEYEFYQFLASEGDSIIVAKRTGRCFPPVEKELAKAGLPDDLKYMLLVESKCVAAAYSRKRASGPWQFIYSTAKRFKLKSNKWRDERRNLELSTEAAIQYLQHLHDIFGDWLLAMAAYNAGESKIKKKLRAQKIDDYWKLHHVRETMRYVPRVIAAKEIFSQPETYLGLAREDLYTPLETEIVTVRIKKRKQHLATVAEKYGTYFLELKMLNPELRRSYLPRGTYKLKVPKRPCLEPCLAEDGAG